MQNKDRLILVEFADGEKFLTDSAVLFERADFIAFSYGLGNFRSLTDFVKMINEEDPFILENLVEAACDRIQASHGIEKEKAVESEDDVDQHTISYTGKVKRSVDSKPMLISFLRDFGATEEEIKEAEEKLKNIKAPEEDFSWITPKILTSPDFDFKGVLSRMNDCYKRSVNVNVSLDKLERKRKKRG